MVNFANANDNSSANGRAPNMATTGAPSAPSASTARTDVLSRRESRCRHGQGTGPCQACLQQHPEWFYDIVLFNDTLQSLGQQTDPFHRLGSREEKSRVGWKLVCNKDIIKTAWPSVEDDECKPEEDDFQAVTKELEAAKLVLDESDPRLAPGFVLSDQSEQDRSEVQMRFDELAKDQVRLDVAKKELQEQNCSATSRASLSTRHLSRALSKDEVGTVLIDMQGVMVNVVGMKDKGKTWLLDRLCQQAKSEVMLPAGVSISTPGICARCCEVNEQHLVLVDVQGGDTPIDSCEQKDMEMAETEDHFLRTIVSKFCDNFLFVMGKLLLAEQKALLALCKLCKAQGKMIFVVHNLLDVKTEEEFDAHIDQTKVLLGASDRAKTTENAVPRRAGTVITYDVDGSERRGRISNPVDGVFVHVEWEEQDQVQDGFPVQEWQNLVRERKILHVLPDLPEEELLQFERLTTDRKTGAEIRQAMSLTQEKYFAMAAVLEDKAAGSDGKKRHGFWEEKERVTAPDGSTRAIRIIRGKMDGVDQVHVFLACDPSVSEGSNAGLNWNQITINHLRSVIIAAGRRTTGEGKAPGRFNYLVQLMDAFDKVMPKVFRGPRRDGQQKNKARPELMRLRDEGQLRLCANLEGEQPGSRLMDFVPEGLFASTFVLHGTEVQNSVRINRYERIQDVGNGFVVDQQLFILEAAGYDKIDTTPCPDNEDVEIDETTLEVRLRRRSPMPNEEWNEHDGQLQDIYECEKICTYDLEMAPANSTEIKQANGLISILITGNRRKERNRRLNIGR
jgi:hypothetical protein